MEAEVEVEVEAEVEVEVEAEAERERAEDRSYGYPCGRSRQPVCGGRRCGCCSASQPHSSPPSDAIGSAMRWHASVFRWRSDRQSPTATDSEPHSDCD